METKEEILKKHCNGLPEPRYTQFILPAMQEYADQQLNEAIRVASESKHGASGLFCQLREAADNQTASLKQEIEDLKADKEILRAQGLEAVELAENVNELRKKLENKVEDLYVELQEKHDLNNSQSELIESLAGALIETNSDLRTKLGLEALTLYKEYKNKQDGQNHA